MKAGQLASGSNAVGHACLSYVTQWLKRKAADIVAQGNVALFMTVVMEVIGYTVLMSVSSVFLNDSEQHMGLISFPSSNDSNCN